MHKDIIRYYIKVATLFSAVLIVLICIVFFFVKGLSVAQDDAVSEQQKIKIRYEDFKISSVESESLVQIKEIDPILTIISEQTPLQDSYATELTEFDRGLKVDARAAENLKNMFSQAEKDGIYLLLCSGYRSVELQQELFDDKVKRVEETGKSHEEAVEIAKTEVAYPGTSEHHTGLAVDIVSFDHQELDNAFGDTVEGKWLAENAHKFGFVLRYPKEKESITGIIFEPWHYRYVGIDHAKSMKEQRLCLEEYVNL